MTPPTLSEENAICRPPPTKTSSPLRAWSWDDLDGVARLCATLAGIGVACALGAAAGVLVGPINYVQVLMGIGVLADCRLHGEAIHAERVMQIERTPGRSVDPSGDSKVMVALKLLNRGEGCRTVPIILKAGSESTLH